MTWVLVNLFVHNIGHNVIAENKNRIPNSTLNHLDEMLPNFQWFDQIPLYKIKTCVIWNKMMCEYDLLILCKLYQINFTLGWNVGRWFGGTKGVGPVVSPGCISPGV